jgi:short-subunit dehydrogenase
VSRPIALVTGASSGIGEALARRLAGEGEDLVVVARSAERLALVARSIEDATGRQVFVLALDLERRDAAAAIRAFLDENGLAVRHLVNNAGYGLAGDMAKLPRDGQLGIVDVNCRALLDLTLACLPDIQSLGGGVLNVASVAGFSAGPGMAVYYASKAFVVSLTRALAVELRGRGVRICALCPGPTATGFGERAGYGGVRPPSLVRSPDADSVARIGLEGYRRGRVVVVPGAVNKLVVGLLRMLPQRLVLPLLAQAQRQRRPPVGGVS